MKVVLLAGGYGTRISEESYLKPKPMIEIGGKPILWHIMKYFSSFGFNEFVICLGYKGYCIKEFFADYYLHTSDVTFDLKNNKMEVHSNRTESWKVSLIDTGLNTMTGGRIKRIKDYVGNEAFFMTYGDGLSNVNLNELLEFHKKSKSIATLTAVVNQQRFGVLDVSDDGVVKAFKEKEIIKADRDLINAGYMVLEPSVFDYIDGDSTSFEKEPLERIVQDGKLTAYVHNGFWQCMDTQRDKVLLEEIYNGGNAPWCVD